MSIDIFNVFGGSSSGNSLIPSRDPGAVTGSSWIQTNMDLIGSVRENNILQEFLHGNIPDFLRNFSSVTVSDGTNSISYLVISDVLSIGSNEDYVRMPMNPHTAQAIADKYDCTLPTRKMVNDIWKNSANKLEPKPWGPPFDADMEKTHRIGTHNATIQAQLAGLDTTALTSGHKKDVIIDKQLLINKHNVGIYGWIYPNGQPIQGLNCTSHSDIYSDYSHGIRLIANDVMVNGNVMRIKDVFADSKLSSLISDEGILSFTHY